MTAVLGTVGSVTVNLLGPDEACEALLGALHPTAFEAGEVTPSEVTIIVTLDDEEAALMATRERRAAGVENVVVVGPQEVLTPRRALDAGARGVVLLERAGAALPPTVEAVRAGQVAIPWEARGQIGRPLLTVREKQTLAMVVLGFSNGEIASKLFVSESTVKSHLGSSFRKLGVTSRNQAIARILDPEGGLGTGILSITGGELIGPSQEQQASA
jgi:DNA-binding NarL/FixJ family response regulator